MPRGYQRAPSREEATTEIPAEKKLLHPNYPFLISSKAFELDSDEDDQFAFSINNDALVDAKEVSIGELIGEGSSSKVYKGLKVHPVSVKILQTQRVSFEQKRKFEREVLLLSKIKHDNIVQNQRPSLDNIPAGVGCLLEACWSADPKARPEFKEITVSPEKLLRSLCSDHDATEDLTISLVQEPRVVYDFPKLKIKTTKMKKKKNKMMNMMAPFLKMFRDCISK